MKKCEFCGKEYDPEEEEDEFSCECITLSYDDLRKDLCADCALQAIEDEVDGVFFLQCDRCGCEFDYILEKGKFDNHFPWYNGTSLSDHWENDILCADCAIVEAESCDDEEES